jgi:glycosyltransferase involved in cell wall biosynthesis
MEFVSKEDINRINRIYEKVRCMFAQTPQMIDFYKKIIDSKEDKFRLLTPMIPEYPAEKPSFANQNNALVYVGKFARAWYIHKVLDVLPSLQGIKLNIAGDKFQQDLENRKEEMIRILENSTNINWVKGISRKQSDELIADSDIGIGWRSPHVDNDNSVHLSTKILEYGRLGKPVILRRTVIHEQLFGSGYPLFADDETEFVNKVNAAVSDPELYKKAAVTVYNACSYYTFSSCYKRLQPVLES